MRPADSKLRPYPTLFKRRKILIGVGAVVLVLILLGICVSSPEDSGSSATETVVEAVPSFVITAQELYDEREANATRYDANFKGKLIRVSGQVVVIDGGDVTLGVDPGFGLGLDTTGLSGVDLTGLTQQEQISLDKGDQVSAMCKVGDYILGSIRLRDCKLD